MLRFRKISEHARAPTRATRHSAGYDLYSAEESIVLQPGERKCISTDLQIQVPDDCYGRIAPRSGLAFHFGMDVLAGVVDKDYMGIVKVILINHGSHSYTVHKGDRIAQLICEVIKYPELEEISDLADSTDSSSSTEEFTRGSNGFGSSGL